MQKITLNSDWSMCEAPMKWDKNYYSEIVKKTDQWYACDVPIDVHMPLIREGIIKDPIISDYCRESEWIEDRSWWFTKCFNATEIDKSADVVELVLEGLDSRADIFINGHFLETHKSVHYPFISDIKEYLQEENILVIRLTSGLEEITKEDLQELDEAVCLETHNGGKFRGDARRSFVRRPQYTVGWDWGPKVITIGITGQAYLRSYRKAAFRELSIETNSIGDAAILKVMMNVENLDLVKTKNCDLYLDLKLEGVVCNKIEKKDMLITAGYNYFDFEIKIENPKLWWPNGYGEQPLYTVEAAIICEGETSNYPTFSYGIRKIEINTDIIEGENRNFTVYVNHMPIYWKGGNWIPNDFIYARVPTEKYHVLIDEAIEANFNMLRIWGGGLYEKDLFYELCDQKGLLIWHDFMFACSTYPDHKEWFRNLMWEELDYQTKRIRNHCSMALYCGTNEVHWIFNSTDNPQWGIEFSHNHAYGLSIPNKMAKEVIRKNCPSIAYWNSSPYGGQLPNDDTVGDVHRWHNGLMSKKMEERIEPKDYDTIESKFVSEYGYIGPCCEKTILEYMDGGELKRESDVWHMHSNVFEKGTVYAGIEKNYVDHAELLSLSDYILYGGMVHGLMYGYSLEAMRFKEHCSGGLFWMYNDAWGEVGWTIIDYYLRRKIPYYAVKRAFAPIKFTLRKVGDNVVLQGLNDTPMPYSTKAEFGYLSFDGTVRKLRRMDLEIAPGSREYLLTEMLPQEDYEKGTMVLMAEDSSIDSIWLRLHDLRNLKYPKAKLKILESKSVGDNWIITVTANSFVHGIYIKGDKHCSDNYFDLLPGECKTITIKEQHMEPIIDQVR